MPEPHYAYVRSLSLVTVCVVMFVASTNLIVDPFRVFALVDIEGFNSIKVRAGQRAALSKTHGVESVQPRSLIIGNSRAEIGFDPNHPAWKAVAIPVYNYALPGAGLQANAGQLEHALSVAPVITAVVGLEFRDFLSRTAKADPSVPMAVPHNIPMPTWAKRARDYADILFSIGAFDDSVRTILGQRASHPPSLTRLGFNPLLEYVPIAMSRGYRSLFDQRNADSARAFLDGGRELFRTGSRSSADLDSFRDLVQLCRRSGLSVNFIIYPYHAETLELFRATGLWTLFEEWKRAIVTILEEDSSRHGSENRYPIWDFSGYSSVTTERVPARGDTKSSMRWYWEAGHFKMEAGNLVLDRIFNYIDVGRTVPQDYGIKITPQSIESHLAHIRSSRERYLSEYADEVLAIEQLVAKLKR